MATFVLTDPVASINGVDLSDHVRAVTVDYKAELQDDTVAGDTTRSRTGGLKDWSMTFEFLQDFAADEVDATLFGIVGTPVTVYAQAVSGAESATNPKFTGTGVLESYSPISGSIGDMATVSVTFQAAGTLTRDTTP